MFQCFGLVLAGLALHNVNVWMTHASDHVIIKCTLIFDPLSFVFAVQLSWMTIKGSLLLIVKRFGGNVFAYYFFYCS